MISAREIAVRIGLFPHQGSSAGDGNPDESASIGAKLSRHRAPRALMAPGGRQGSEAIAKF
jgi:hypothetical protein